MGRGSTNMDIASLIGFLGAMGMIAGAMISAGGLGMYIDVPSMLIVFGGTFFAVMYRCELPQFLGSFGVMGKVFMPGKRSVEDLISRVSELATIARKDGMMALEGQEVPDKFNEQLQLELAAMKKRHETNQGVIGSWIDIGPAMGMIGTLVGLVAMLGNMADPKAIGPAMAVALLTTLYGAMLANVIFLPMKLTLEQNTQKEIVFREMIVSALRAISRGESPRNIQDQLVAQMPPKIQAKIEEAA